MTTASTSEKLQQVLERKPIKNAQKLERQQRNYERLVKKGATKKQTYKLKSSLSE
jgi:hypothetical protein